MFSGIVETRVSCLKAEALKDIVQIVLVRPKNFDDIKCGDSIAVNGVCLTVESFDENSMQFSLAQETLQVTGWTLAFFEQASLNVERSLRFGDRIHGHLVAGHVEVMAKVLDVSSLGESLILKLELPESIKAYVWHKGSLTVNGVSLTINKAEVGSVEFCVIPETMDRSNLEFLKPGDLVTLEPDYMARAALKFFSQRGSYDQHDA